MEVLKVKLPNTQTYNEVRGARRVEFDVWAIVHCAFPYGQTMMQNGAIP